MAKKGGRPTAYTKAAAATILGLLAEGKSLRRICADESLPAESTVRGWVVDDRKERGEKEGFAARYARARDVGLDAMADEVIDIADDGTNDWTEKKLADGETDTVLDHEHVTRSRLRVDTRKWYLSKMAPKRYGDKLEVDANLTLDAETAKWLGRR